MNSRRIEYLEMDHLLPRVAVRQSVWSAATLLGLAIATAGVAGQDRIRIVESPRTAMRETRSVARPVPRAGVPAGREDASSTSSVGGEEHFVTEMQEQFRTVYVPVIENQTEPSSAWWDPLGLSARTFQPRPVVRWEQRVEKVRVPIRYRELVNDKTELRNPTRSASSADRPATRPNGNNRLSAPNRQVPTWPPGSPGVIPKQQFGGISRLESDQPRYSTLPDVKVQRVVR